MRRMVASASGRRTPADFPSSRVRKMDGQGIDQSMISAARRCGRARFAFTSGLSAGAWVGSGQTMGLPSQRAIRNSRLRMVAAP
ncbi:hypothetical protein D9M68_817320 [compost metagenome]